MTAAVEARNVRPSMMARSLAGYVWPPLTSVRQPTRRLGWEAADLLLAGDPDGPPEARETPFTLIERASNTAVSGD